ncbi:MAG: multifunctional tRNA nucleotidyl transferase/2'3'-cyclic phosphodiesterase/2'nucleotidase/phosphatase [Firmicutes bacterium ADurb.Bin182]|nr:MAG: multifunctional tRNA nucleotidyl transferase/2'3'-cyclic phosphodiesterase/2'nucleotidase/phosphatase [Firmicutes bacterium ADurb.Bin182]
MLGTEETELVFREMNTHLTEDDVPSIYFDRISALPWFSQPPFNILLDLKKAEQNLLHHPEGNAWMHTLMVVDEAASVKSKSKDPCVFMWAALLHDVGKPGTTKYRKGRITSYDHDKLGAKLVREFLEKMPVDRTFTDKTASLVRWHMQILFVVKGLPFADVQSMRRDTDVLEVALLGLCDRMGRKGADRAREEETIRLFLEKCSAAQPCF